MLGTALQSPTFFVWGKMIMTSLRFVHGVLSRMGDFVCRHQKIKDATNGCILYFKTFVGMLTL